ncbi:MAG TPA: hypothetical protein VJ827_08250 [Rubrobacter sp.]|nr:hypothetical protein [Rubrobacter sp.]
MWAEIEKNLPHFETAVLNVPGQDGYPYSVRCRAERDRPAGILRLEPAEIASIQTGPASLLCHRHDEELWNQRIFLLRGRVEGVGDGLIFRPEKFIPSIGTGGVTGVVRMLIGARRATTAYLKKRSLARPTIPWSEIEAVKEET